MGMNTTIRSPVVIVKNLNHERLKGSMIHAVLNAVEYKHFISVWTMLHLATNYIES